MVVFGRYPNNVLKFGWARPSLACIFQVLQLSVKSSAEGGTVVFSTSVRWFYSHS